VESELGQPDDSKYDCAAQDESYMELKNGIKDADCPAPRVVSAMPNASELVGATPNSKRQD